MKLLFTCLFIISAAISALSQTDTTIKYYSNKWKECGKDTATYYSKIYPLGNVWKHKGYRIKDIRLQSEETWLDGNCTQPVDTSVWYNDKGIVNELPRGKPTGYLRTASTDYHISSDTPFLYLDFQHTF